VGGGTVGGGIGDDGASGAGSVVGGQLGAARTERAEAKAIGTAATAATVKAVKVLRTPPGLCQSTPTISSLAALAASGVRASAHRVRHRTDRAAA
jgi:hypothetical protein